LKKPFLFLKSCKDLSRPPMFLSRWDIIICTIGSSYWVFKLGSALILTRHLVPNLLWVALTLKMTPPPIFLDPVLWSRSRHSLYYLSMSLWYE